MERKKFIDTFSDDTLCVEEAYRIYLEKHPEANWIIWSSLCRVYTLVAVSCVDFFIEHVLEKAKLNSDNCIKINIENIVKCALNKDKVPNELDIPDKIEKYVCLRELRHYIIHASNRENRELKIKLIALNLDVDKFTEKEFNIIKKIIQDMTNLIGMSMCVIDNP